MERYTAGETRRGDAPAALVHAVNWLIRRRLLLLLISLIAAAFAVEPAQRLDFDRSVEGMFHEADPRLVSYYEDQRLFGGAETALVAYSDPNLLTVAGLERLEQFDARLRELPGVHNTVSLAHARLPGAPFNSRSLKDHLAAGTVAPVELREELLECDLYRGRLLAADGETAVILVNLAAIEPGVPRRDRTIAHIRRLCEEHDPPAVLAGGPVIVEDVYHHLEADGRLLGISSSIVLAVVIAFLFRNLRWVILPLAVVQLTLVWTKALMVVSGMQLSMVSSPLVALVTVIGVATVVHVAIRFREECLRHSPVDALKETMIHIGPAIFWTSLTTAAGFSSLLASRIVPVAGFGLMMALGATIVFCATTCLLSAGVLSGRYRAQPLRPPGENMVAVVLDRIIVTADRYPIRVATIGIGLLGLTSLGFLQLEVATDFDENFRRSSPIVKSYQFITDRLGTMSTFDVLIDVPDINDRRDFDEFLERLRALQQDLKQFPPITGTLSAVDVLDFMSHTRAEQAGPLGLAQAVVLARLTPAQRLELLRRIQPDFISSFWNRDRGVMRIVVQAGKTKGAEAKRRLLEEIEETAQRRFPSARLAGVDILLTYLVQSLLTDQWITFGLAVAAILVMMMIAFRDWRLGLIALVPNVAPILIVVGVMGWAGLKINMATAMLASVSMGLAVDFSIHYVYRYRYELRAGKSIDAALRDAHGSVGLAMVLANIALVAGFSTLTMSSFIPTIHFGILVSVAMLGGLAGNLIALPLLLRLLHR